MHAIIWLALLPLKLAALVLHTALMILFLPILLPLFFLPTIIAYLRGHPSRFAIFIVNLIFGWNALGWIVALIWSATAVDPRLARGPRA